MLDADPQKSSLYKLLASLPVFDLEETLPWFSPQIYEALTV